MTRTNRHRLTFRTSGCRIRIGAMAAHTVFNRIADEVRNFMIHIIRMQDDDIAAGNPLDSLDEDVYFITNES